MCHNLFLVTITNIGQVFTVENYTIDCALCYVHYLNHCAGALAKGNNSRGVNRVSVPGSISFVIPLVLIQGHWCFIIHTVWYVIWSGA